MESFKASRVAIKPLKKLIRLFLTSKLRIVSVLNFAIEYCVLLPLAIAICLHVIYNIHFNISSYKDIDKWD